MSKHMDQILEHFGAVEPEDILALEEEIRRQRDWLEGLLAHQIRERARQHDGNPSILVEASDPPLLTKRNSPCPCGSGEKYKKCCRGKSILPSQLQRPPLKEQHDQHHQAGENGSLEAPESLPNPP